MWGSRLVYRSSVPLTSQARRQKFSEGGSFDTAGGLGPLKAPRSPWVFGAKSCNFQTLHSNFRKALFSITNFWRFSSNFTPIRTLGLNKSSTLIVFISFQRGGGSYEPLEPPPGYGCASTQLQGNSLEPLFEWDHKNRGACNSRSGTILKEDVPAQRNWTPSKCL